MAAATRKDSKPELSLLESFEIPGVGSIEPSGLLVVVGPNSSGKTMLLRDLHMRLTGQPRNLVVLDAVRMRPPPRVAPFVELLETEGYLHRRKQPGQEDVLVSAEPHLGLQQAAGEVNINDLTDRHRRFVPNHERPAGDPRTQAFLQYIGQLLTTALFLDNRLSWQFSVGHFDYQNARPANELQGVYFEGALSRKLSAELRRVFGRAVWVDGTRGGQICIRVSDERDLPPEQDRLDPRAMLQFRMMETEGDGLKSYTAMCLALLLSRRPVCLIDEPETCLHPPQAYAIGRFIGGSDLRQRNRCVIVATHSSHVLRGITEAAADVQIVRMTRVGGQFLGHLVDRDPIRAVMRNPHARSERVLDGIFANGVLIVEAEGDRAVYQAALEAGQPNLGRDILFVSSGGTGGFAEIASFHRAMRIPTLVVADLDFLLDVDKVSRVAAALGASRDHSREATAACRAASRQIRTSRPSISEEEIRSQLNAIGGSEFNWDDGDDGRIAGRLRALATKVDRLKRLKEGLASFQGQPNVAVSIQSAIDRCRRCGILLVPVGELEGWSPEPADEGEGGDGKRGWAVRTAAAIIKDPGKFGGVIGFVRDATSILFPADPASDE